MRGFVFLWKPQQPCLEAPVADVFSFAVSGRWTRVTGTSERIYDERPRGTLSVVEISKRQRTDAPLRGWSLLDTPAGDFIVFAPLEEDIERSFRRCRAHSHRHRLGPLRWPCHVRRPQRWFPSSNMCHEGTSARVKGAIGVGVGTITLDGFKKTEGRRCGTIVAQK
jgi:hypothetical protein